MPGWGFSARMTAPLAMAGENPRARDAGPRKRLIALRQRGTQLQPRAERGQDALGVGADQRRVEIVKSPGILLAECGERAQALDVVGCGAVGSAYGSLPACARTG